MGQYYRIVLKDAKDNMESYEPIDGYKLMEFSWCPSDTTAFICNKLAEPKRVYVIGDYASDSDNKNIHLDGARPLDILRGVKPIPCKQVEYDYTNKWVFNITKGVCFPINSNNAIFGLFLLCSIGNGLGGGDYSGINQNCIGAWYGDFITIREFKPGDSDNYAPWEAIFDEY